MVPKIAPKPCTLSYPEAKLFYGRKKPSRRRYSTASLIEKAKYKKLQGLKLTAVEAHLLRRVSRIKRRLFAPSRFSVLGEIARVFLQPIPIILVLTLIVASEASSRAWFESSLELPKVFTEEQQDSVQAQALAEEEDSLIERFMEQSSLALQFERKQLEPAHIANNQTGLIQFISGLIAVYCPSVKDPGLIARHIVETSKNEQIDPLYIAAVIATESGFRTGARSRVGATGLMQLLPATAREVAKKELGKRAYPRLTDPEQNIRLGISYLKQLESRFGGNRTLALAAYNWGPANVNKADRSVRRFPKSVQLYSSKILEKTLRWNKHFKRATDSAKALQESMNS